MSEVLPHLIQQKRFSVSFITHEGDNAASAFKKTFNTTLQGVKLSLTSDAWHCLGKCCSARQKLYVGNMALRSIDCNRLANSLDGNLTQRLPIELRLNPPMGVLAHQDCAGFRCRLHSSGNGHSHAHRCLFPMLAVTTTRDNHLARVHSHAHPQIN